MYGRIVKVIAVEGKREELVAILLEGAAGMPGCLSYVVAKDASDANAMWITEVWDSKSSRHHEGKATDRQLQQQRRHDTRRRARPGPADGSVTADLGSVPHFAS